MAVHVFTLVLGQEPTDEQFDALVEAGCDDASFGIEHGRDKQRAQIVLDAARGGPRWRS